MKIVKNIFIGLGVLLVLLIVFIMFMSSQTSKFKEESTDFTETYIKKLSSNWDINSVSNSSTNLLISQVNTPKGLRALKQFETLGKLVSMGDTEVKSYRSNISGITTGTLLIKVKFENADTLVTITLQEKDNITKTNAFNISPISNISTQTKTEA